MKKIACGVIIVALVLGNAGLALAWPGHGGGGHLARVRVFVGTSVFVGPVWWGPAWYPYPYPYPYPVTYPAPTVVQQEAPTYAPPATTAQYWYYCPDSKAYYPYIQQCPSGWLQVVPSPPAPGPRE